VKRSVQLGVGAAGGQQRCVRRVRRGPKRGVWCRSIHARPEERHLPSEEEVGLKCGGACRAACLQALSALP
jgi:hypothetical protein